MLRLYFCSVYMHAFPFNNDEGELRPITGHHLLEFKQLNSQTSGPFNIENVLEASGRGLFSQLSVCPVVGHCYSPAEIQHTPPHQETMNVSQMAPYSPYSAFIVHYF